MRFISNKGNGKLTLQKSAVGWEVLLQLASDTVMCDVCVCHV